MRYVCCVQPRARSCPARALYEAARLKSLFNHSRIIRAHIIAPQHHSKLMCSKLLYLVCTSTSTCLVPGMYVYTRMYHSITGVSHFFRRSIERSIKTGTSYEVCTRCVVLSMHPAHHTRSTAATATTAHASHLHLRDGKPSSLHDGKMLKPRLSGAGQGGSMPPFARYIVLGTHKEAAAQE